MTQISHVSTPLIPFILLKSQSEQELLEGIKDGHLYGFLICSLSSPPQVIQKYKTFPPIIKRFKITDELVTNFMAERIRSVYPGAGKFERETLIQCFNAKDHLIMTTTARYYMKMGITIYNVKKFIQYIPRKSISPFASHVTRMRIEAEKNHDSTKSATAKTFGNSGYGKVIL